MLLSDLLNYTIKLTTRILYCYPLPYILHSQFYSSRHILNIIMNKQKNELIKPAQEVSLNLLDEDPFQPRQYFDSEALEELADSIKNRGVKTPISVRFNQKSGRYTINHGHRRFRASKIAGRKTIPAYIDNDYNDEDQVIENLHRQDLTSREIADYVGRQVALGKTQQEIATSLSKSTSWVGLYAKLLNLPESLSLIFHSGRCVDVSVMHLLLVAYKVDPVETNKWLDNNKEDKINRRAAQALKDFIEYRQKQTSDPSYINPSKSSVETTIKNRIKDSKNLESDEMAFSVFGSLNRIWKHNYRESHLIKIFSPTEINQIRDCLFDQYNLGKQNKDDVIDTVRFALKEIPLKGAGAYLFMSYLLGKEGTDFDFQKIMDNIRTIRTEMK